MAKRKDRRYHCDGYYFNKVCPFRGDIDRADIRLDDDGFIKPQRNICWSEGISPFDEVGMCRHCIENRKFFRKEPRVLTGRVVDITNFQAKEEGTARTIKAFDNEERLRQFMKDVDTSKIYGVETRSGILID